MNEKKSWKHYGIWLTGPLLGLLLGLMPFFALPGYFFAEWSCGGDITTAACDNTRLAVITLCANVVLYSLVWFLVLGVAHLARKEK